MKEQAEEQEKKREMNGMENQTREKANLEEDEATKLNANGPPKDVRSDAVTANKRSKSASTKRSKYWFCCPVR